ncbi:protein artichoke-like [Wyeomyia smithii]|uniref:protein artichoke-like n=1 Tax=Wyeomyia smithii TaxID=174621 RepID=UPI002467B113|nr:protein artichoke-like [Wyeomyia smithii]
MITVWITIVVGVLVTFELVISTGNDDFVDACFGKEGDKPPHCEYIDFDDVFESSDIKFNWSFITKLTISNKRIVGIPTRMFESLPNLESFIVVNSLFYREIDPNSFIDCHKLEHIEITGTNISFLDSHLFPKTPNLKQLLCHHNKITEIKHDAFEFLIGLEELNLSYNNLTRLSSGVFHTLKNLKTLDLNHNRLLLLSFDSWFPPDGVHSLAYLDVSYNQLIELAWSEITTKKVNLKYNNLTSIQIAGNCSELHVSYNALQSVTVGSNCSIEKLYLAHNYIRNFGDLRKCSESLRTLDISFNVLQRRFDFLGMKQLTALNVECTNITIEYTTLHDLRKLRFLDISYNNIKKIDFENLTSQRLLERLMISGNPIANMSIESIKRNFPNLKSLGIYDLPWNESSLSVAIEDLKKHDIKPYIKNDYLFEESLCPLKVVRNFSGTGDENDESTDAVSGSSADKTVEYVVIVLLVLVVSGLLSKVFIDSHYYRELFKERGRRSSISHESLVSCDLNG